MDKDKKQPEMAHPSQPPHIWLQFNAEGEVTDSRLENPSGNPWYTLYQVAKT